jgi:hypothetical protein
VTHLPCDVHPTRICNGGIQSPAARLLRCAQDTGSASEQVLRHATINSDSDCAHRISVVTRRHLSKLLCSTCRSHRCSFSWCAAHSAATASAIELSRCGTIRDTYGQPHRDFRADRAQLTPRSKFAVARCQRVPTYALVDSVRERKASSANHFSARVKGHLFSSTSVKSDEYPK